MALTKIRQEQGVVINDGSTDVDFRVASDNAGYAFFINGEDGTVQIGGSNAVGNQGQGRVVFERGNGDPHLVFFRNDTSIASNNVLGAIRAYNNDTASNAITELARIEFVADGAFNSGDNPTAIRFFGTPDGTDDIAELGRFDNQANFKIENTFIGGGAANTPARFYHNTAISLADDATLALVNSSGGAMTINVYNANSGEGATFFVTYTSTVQIINEQGPWAAADTDGSFCVFSSANAHAVTLKNRTGSTQSSVFVTIIAARAN